MCDVVTAEAGGVGGARVPACDTPGELDVGGACVVPGELDVGRTSVIPGELEVGGGCVVPGS